MKEMQMKPHTVKFIDGSVGIVNSLVEVNVPYTPSVAEVLEQHLIEPVIMEVVEEAHGTPLADGGA